MPHPARESIYDAIASIRLIDPHTHINPHSPASSTLADLLGYHYYTELAHSAGMPKDQIEEEGLPPRELVRRLVDNLGAIENTAQYSWLVQICQSFFGFQGDRLDSTNWQDVYDDAESRMSRADWPQTVLDQSNVEAVFLTNDFDDPLSGFDTDTYIPCLRTDDLVFHLAKYQTRQRLAACSGIELDGSLEKLRASLEQRFEHFTGAGARACAISLPPSFEPTPVSDGRSKTALDEILRKGALADESHQRALSRRVFWTLAELCDQFGLPFDLMIGVNRGVYSAGVFQGQDLYDSRVSLIQYKELFNAFPQVKFPISVLASVTNQELVSYAWIFPNVITNGHWWYSNTPSFISRDAAARLEAVPRTKQIAYYSDAYKLEFVLPKFDMYRRILSGILADHFVGECGWSEERAIELGHQVLRGNVDHIFPKPAVTTGHQDRQPSAEFTTVVETDAGGEPSVPTPGLSDTVVEDDPEDMLAKVEQFRSQAELPNRPTTVDHGTIEEDQDLTIAEEPQATPSSGVETIVQPLSDPEDLDLDPSPGEDEIQSVELDDVELLDTAVDREGPTAGDIDAEAEIEPLDVGDLLGEQTDAISDQVHMLRGDTSFSPDEDSLQLHANPTTGELTFPVPGDEDVSEHDTEVPDDIPSDKDN